MIGVLIWLLIFLVIFAAVWYVIDQIPVDATFKQIAKVIILVVGLIFLIILLLHLGGLAGELRL